MRPYTMEALSPGGGDQGGHRPEDRANRLEAGAWRGASQWRGLRSSRRRRRQRLLAGVRDPPHLDEVLQATEPSPERLDSWLPVALAAQEAPELGNPADGRPGVWRWFVRRDDGLVPMRPKRLPFVLRQEGRAGGVGMGTSHEVDVQEAPSDDQVCGQGPPEAVGGLQLQLLVVAPLLRVKWKRSMDHR